MLFCWGDLALSSVETWLSWDDAQRNQIPFGQILRQVGPLGRDVVTSYLHFASEIYYIPSNWECD